MPFFPVALGVARHDSARADVSIINEKSGLIQIQGEIRKGDAAVFAGLAKELSEHSAGFIGAPPNGVPMIQVWLNSPGGDVAEALAIGRQVRQRFAFTIVPYKMECDSACVSY